MTTGGKPAPKVGHRVSKIDMHTGKVSVFAINKSDFAASHTGGGGLERPINVVFGPFGSMYIVDFGMEAQGNGEEYIAQSGVIWKVIREK